MAIYLDLVLLLNFLIDFLLLVCAERLAGFTPSWIRLGLAALLGGAYSGLCLIPGLKFMGDFGGRIISLCGIAIIAFGFEKATVRKAVLFVLLTMALGGAASGIQNGSFGALIGTALSLAILCVIGFRGKTETADYVPVELVYQGKQIRTTALSDTGNTLLDPITGEKVLIADASIGEKLTGLTPGQLRNPVETMLKPPIKGLRLIPYCTVGNSGGMLLALRCDQVRIGGKQGSLLVAFSPEQIGKGDVYQVLAGGI